MGPDWGLGGTRPLPTSGPHLRPQKAQKIPTNASVTRREPPGEGASFEKLLTTHWPVAGSSWKRAREHAGRRPGSMLGEGQGHGGTRLGSMLVEGWGACGEKAGEHDGRKTGEHAGRGSEGMLG